MKIRRNSAVCAILISSMLSSCLITDRVGSVSVEVLKPASLTIPENVRTVAFIKRDNYQSDTFKVGFIDNFKVKIDSTVKYSELSNKCVDAAADFFRNHGNFEQVYNYRDSLNGLIFGPVTDTSHDLLSKKSNADLLVFLDYFHMNNAILDFGNKTVFHSTPRLRWTLNFRNDSSIYYFDQKDTLWFDNTNFNVFDLRNRRSRKTLESCAVTEGELFGSKLIPTWITVDRMYYKSNNTEMLKAEKLALKNEWNGAAQVWKNLTKNKNQRIATKAKYNMALACEMEGRPDLAIEWITKSFIEYMGNDERHKDNCQRYINVLATRKMEIARLEKQVSVLKEPEVSDQMP